MKLKSFEQWANEKAKANIQEKNISIDYDSKLKSAKVDIEIEKNRDGIIVVVCPQNEKDTDKIRKILHYSWESFDGFSFQKTFDDLEEASMELSGLSIDIPEDDYYTLDEKTIREKLDNEGKLIYDTIKKFGENVTLGKSQIYVEFFDEDEAETGLDKIYDVLSGLKQNNKISSTPLDLDIASENSNYLKIAKKELRYMDWKSDNAGTNILVIPFEADKEEEKPEIFIKIANEIEKALKDSSLDKTSKSILLQISKLIHT